MRRLGRLIWLIVTILLVTVAIAFVTFNEALIALYIWPFDRTLMAPTWLVVISSFIIGGLFSIAILWAQWITIRTRMWRLQGKFNKLKAEKFNQQIARTTHKDMQAKWHQNEDGAYDHDKQDQRILTGISKPLRTGRNSG